VSSKFLTAPDSSETSVYMYQTTRRHIKEDSLPPHFVTSTIQLQEHRATGKANLCLSVWDGLMPDPFLSC